MGLAERVFDGLRAALEMRADLDRMSDRLDRVADEVLDHEKRLIRIETMIEMSQSRTSGRPQLPDA
jgi:hypothetical protein